MPALRPGDTAPDFSTEDCDGKRLSLVELMERGPLVLAFFGRAFTPI